MSTRTYPFTVWLDHDPEWKPPEAGHPDIKYFVAQPERCPTSGRVHFQCFVRFKRPRRIRGAQKILGCSKKTKFIYPTEGTDAQNKDYCTDPSKRLEGYDYIEWGEMSSQGSRTDLATMLSDGKEGKLELTEENADTAARHFRFYMHCRSLYKGPTWRDVKVYWLYGDAGTGKTRSAYESNPELYCLFSQSPEWWDGYTGEDTVLIDEYRGDMPIHRLLRVIDGYRLQLPVKGGSTWMLATTIYITSNFPPEYFAQGVNLRALTRRLTEVKEMARSPPGETDF